MESIDDILNEVENNHFNFITEIYKYWGLVSDTSSMLDAYDTSIAEMKEKWPLIPDDEWVLFKKALCVDQMEADFQSVFMKYITYDELKEIIKLYETYPILIKLKNISDGLSADSILVAKKWLFYVEKVMLDIIVVWNTKGYLNE
jgi:hypothetical protein